VLSAAVAQPGGCDVWPKRGALSRRGGSQDEVSAAGARARGLAMPVLNAAARSTTYGAAATRCWRRSVTVDSSARSLF